MAIDAKVKRTYVLTAFRTSINCRITIKSYPEKPKYKVFLPFCLLFTNNKVVSYQCFYQVWGKKCDNKVEIAEKNRWSWGFFHLPDGIFQRLQTHGWIGFNPGTALFLLILVTGLSRPGNTSATAKRYRIQAHGKVVSIQATLRKFFSSPRNIFIRSRGMMNTPQLASLFFGCITTRFVARSFMVRK
jgi:hypothetical protein